jgi:hypothetical protein
MMSGARSWVCLRGGNRVWNLRIAMCVGRFEVEVEKVVRC